MLGWLGRMEVNIKSAPSLTAPSATAPLLDVVVVGGAGHVGLPLSLAFAEAGLRVGILDVAEDTLARIGGGEMPFLEPGAPELLASALESGHLELSSLPEMLGRAERVVIVIGTPIDEFLNPSMTAIDRTIAQLAAHLRDGAVVGLLAGPHAAM